MKELSDLYGSSEAVRNFAIERHTVDDIIKLVHEHGWEKDVSLVEGGHLVLLLTQKEVDDVILDIELAKKAGVEGIDAVKVIPKEEVVQVRLCLLFHLFSLGLMGAWSRNMVPLIRF